MSTLTLTAPSSETQISQNIPPASPQPIQEILSQHLRLLGSISWLMLHSPLHRHYSMEMMEARIMPSLIHNQFRFYEVNGTPIGFVNWAWLSEEVEEKFQTGEYQLQLEEWKSGDRLWFPEFIAPFGHAKHMVKDVRSNVFKMKTPAKALRIGHDGTLRSIAHYTV